MARTYKRDKSGRFSYVAGGKGRSNSRSKGSAVSPEGLKKLAAKAASGQASQTKTGSSGSARAAAPQGRDARTGSPARAKRAASLARQPRTSPKRKSRS